MLNSPVFSGPVFLSGVFAASNFPSLRGTGELFGSYVDRTFLVRAIRYYRETPAAREAIGTPEGLAHLRTAVGSSPGRIPRPGPSG